MADLSGFEDILGEIDNTYAAEGRAKINYWISVVATISFACAVLTDCYYSTKTLAQIAPIYIALPLVIAFSNAGQYVIASYALDNKWMRRQSWIGKIMLLSLMISSYAFDFYTNHNGLWQAVVTAGLKGDEWVIITNVFSVAMCFAEWFLSMSFQKMINNKRMLEKTMRQSAGGRES